MIDFGDTKKIHVHDYTREEKKLDISEVLKHIDNGNKNYYNTLSDDEKKLFTPYTVLRYMGSLDDSLTLSYSSKSVESVFGTWKSGAKKILEELYEEFNTKGTGTVTSVKKYEHAKYDWRIGFSLTPNAVEPFKECMKEFGLTAYGTETMIDSFLLKNYLIMLNELVNINMWEMNNHHELIFEMMCSIHSVLGTTEMKRTWLDFPKGMKNVDAKVLDVIKQSLPRNVGTQLNESEYRILLSSSNEEFKELLGELGYSASDEKDLMKRYKKERTKYGYEAKE